MNPLGNFALCRLELQVVPHVDAADDQHLAVQLDLAGRFRGQPTLAGGDPARLQRATKGSRQSPRGGRDDVVQRGGVRLVDAGVHAIVLRHL